MKKLFLLLALLGSFVFQLKAQDVSFYVYAHPDDWQLFMGLDAYKDIITGSYRKVVLVQVGAGEHGNGAGQQTTYNNKTYLPFYLARLSGSEKSVQFSADIASQHTKWTVYNESIMGHRILKKVYKNVVMYTLFLSDGGSLPYLCYEDKPAKALDGSAIYSSKQDLVNTINQIFRFETIGYPPERRQLHITDPDRCINPDDHPDHRVAALIALEANRTLKMPTLAYETYGIRNKQVNLTPEEIVIKGALFGLADLGRTENNIWPSFVVFDTTDHHVRWVSRQYSRKFNYSQLYYIERDIPCNSRPPQNREQPDTAGTTLFAPKNTYFSPNPVAAHFDLTYSVPEEGWVKVELYDAGGRAAGLVLFEYKTAGMHSLRYSTIQLSPGTYFLKVITSGYRHTEKFIKI